MKIRAIQILIVAVLGLSASSFVAADDHSVSKESSTQPGQSDVGQAESFPTDKSILFWSQEQRTAAFRIMEKLAPTRTISAGSNSETVPRPLSPGSELDITWTVGEQDYGMARYMQEQNAVGIMIVHKGKVRFEEYRAGFSAEQRWTSFSVAKSFTSTLVGAALKDGDIESLDDPVTRYIPDLVGSGYDGVTVEQLLTMESGVAWNEDYADPESDVVKFGNQAAIDGADPTVLYMKTLQREAQPGTRWQYNTGETNLIGVLVANATGKTLSDYLSEKVWKPYGMASDAVWILNAGNREIAGCCVSATLGDYARIGLFALEGGIINGESVVPENWFKQAGSKQADIGRPGFGYGYQWWTYDDGSFAAQGIFGQGIFIDPSRDLVIASHSNWKVASNDAYKLQRNQFYSAVQQAIDAETAK